MFAQSEQNRSSPVVSVPLGGDAPGGPGRVPHVTPRARRLRQPAFLAGFLAVFFAAFLAVVFVADFDAELFFACVR